RTLRDHPAQRPRRGRDHHRGRADVALERLGDHRQQRAGAEARRAARRVRSAGAGRRRSRAGLHGALPLARGDAAVSLVETLEHGPIRELRLARPPVNALDPALSHAIAEAVAGAVAAGARGLVLSGGPKVFSAGLDVPSLVSLGAGRKALRAPRATLFEAARAL